uniref:Uncharacterized protein n=1 Tax=Romanomermis culicivorax TaxID=13658 RepID=A0A915KPU9_ROMCU
MHSVEILLGIMFTGKSTLKTDDEDNPHFHKEWLLKGPKQRGDPNDLWIRNIERENAIPKILMEKVKKEKCPEELK